MVGFVADEAQAKYESYHKHKMRNKRNNYRRIYESIENNRLELMTNDKNTEISGIDWNE